MKVIASLNDDILKNGVLFIKDVFAPLMEKKPFTTREEAVNYLMEIINPLNDIRLNNAIVALSGRFAPNMWKKLYPETNEANTLIDTDVEAWPPMGDTDNVITAQAPLSPSAVWAAAGATLEVQKPKPEDEDGDAKILRVMKATGLDWEEAWIHVRVQELEDGASGYCSEECEGHSSAMSVLVEAVRRGKAKRNARRRAEGRLAYLSDSDDEEKKKKEYVAPPRVRDADRHWPYMRCKNIVNALYRYNPNRNEMPRNHHALLEYIASLKKITIDELKKMSPVEYFTEVDKTRRPGEALTLLVKRAMSKVY